MSGVFWEAPAPKREQQAYRFYAGLSAALGPVGLLRELVEKLKDEEYPDTQPVKAMLADLNMGKETV